MAPAQLSIAERKRRITEAWHAAGNFTYERHGYSLTLVQTGIPPALTARLLVTGKIAERGVMMPEALDPEAVMNSFTREGLPIFVEKREVERL